MRRLINQRPGRLGLLTLGLLPFVVLLSLYLGASAVRLAENPNDKLMPSLSAMAEAVERAAFQPDRRSGDYVLWADTAASLARLGAGVGLAALAALVFGVAAGLIPYAGATLSPVVAVISMIPPMAVLPILFITLGLGDIAKITLIAIGVGPFLVRDLSMRVAAIPRELLIKAETLGASTWQIVVRVVLPQVLPRLIDAVRLSLGPAWLFLIAAEGIAATEGLGYRIFLVRRFLAMDVILPYVVWITFLAAAMDLALRLLSKRLFAWTRVPGAV